MDKVRPENQSKHTPLSLMPMLLRSPLGGADPVAQSAAATGELIKKYNQDSRRRSAPPRARGKRKKEGGPRRAVDSRSPLGKPTSIPQITNAGEAAIAKIASLVVKVGALLVILYLPTQFALNLQLLGGMWILQTLPALVFGLYTRWFKAPGHLAGWVVGISTGTYLAWMDNWKPLHALTFGDDTVTIYVGLVAIVANIAVAVLVNAGMSLCQIRNETVSRCRNSLA